MALSLKGRERDAQTGMTIRTHRPAARCPERVALVVTMLVVLMVTSASASETPTSDDWVDWAVDRSLVLDPVQWPETAPEELDSVADGVDEARVVFLGEPDHYIS